jgi:ribokinase
MIQVIGNAAVDSVIRVDRLPQPGETIVALGASEELGGKGANQAVAAARCGARVRLVAAIGDDAQGERIRAMLAREEVLTDGMAISSYGTDRCVIAVDRRGENIVFSLVNASRNFDPIVERQIESWLAPGDFVVMQGNLSPGVTRDCLALARARGATTVLNPSPTYAAQDYDWTLVDLVLVNQGEGDELAGDGADHPARTLCEKGAGAVVLTLGAKGAAFFSPGDSFCIAAPRVTAIDAVGAGDVFCGVMIAAKVLGHSWRQALAAATGAASASVGRLGVLASFPSREDMATILKRVASGPLEEHHQ